MENKQITKRILSLLLALVMIVGIFPVNIFANTSNRQIGPDLTRGNLNDLLTFFGSPGYKDGAIRYSGLEFINTENNLINLMHTRHARGWAALGGFQQDPSQTDYFHGKYIIRFQDKNLYDNIDTITISGRPFTKYNFGTNNELNGSTWVIRFRDLVDYGKVGVVENENVQISLKRGTSLESLNLVNTKLYYDQLMIDNDGYIEKNSVANGFIEANDDKSTNYNSNFLTGIGTNKALLDLTPGQEALKLVYTFKPDENYLQTNYAWVAYFKAIIPPELMKYLDNQTVTVYNSTQEGNLGRGISYNRNIYNVSVSEENVNKGIITTRETRALSIHKDAGYEYIDPATGLKVSEGRIPLTLKDLNDARRNTNHIYWGTLGQSRSVTFRIPLKGETSSKEFLQKIQEIANNNNGKIPLETALEGDWPDFNIGQTASPNTPDKGAEPRTINYSNSQSFISLVDSDGDGLPDFTELSIGTDPAIPDTDGDGVSDGQEILDDSTDPLDARSYKPGVPRTTDNIIEVDKENTITGALDEYTTLLEGKSTRLKSTDAKAGNVKVFIAKYLDNNGEPSFDTSRTYASTTISLEKLKTDRAFTLTMPANQLPANQDYILVAQSPDGKVSVVGDRISTKGIVLHANNGTDERINVPVATNGKTQLPELQDKFTVANKQLVGFSTDKNAILPENIDGTFIGNATKVDVSKLSSRDLYAVYKDIVTVTVNKKWQDAQGSSLTPPNATVKVGLMYRTAVGAPHAEIIHDPLAAYFPVKNTVKALRNNTASWTLPGYDKYGNRLSYIVAEIREGDEARFENFDPGTGSWADLDIKLYETEFNDPTDLNSGIKNVGHKEQFIQFKSGAPGAEQIDTYSSATTRTVALNPTNQGNFYDSYTIEMTNTKIDLAPPRIVQGYVNETQIKIVAPNDETVTRMEVTIGNGTPIVLTKDTADGIFKAPQGSSVEVKAPTDGGREYLITTAPLAKDTEVVAKSFNADNVSAEDIMIVRERVPSGIPTDLKQEKKDNQNNAVVTAVPGTISGDKVPAGTTYELVKDDGTGNFVPVDQEAPIMGEVGQDGKIKFTIPENKIPHGSNLKVRQKSPEQIPSDSKETIALDLQGPVITTADLSGFVNTQITNVQITTDEPASMKTISQDKLPEGIIITTGANDSQYNLPKEWTLSGTPRQASDKTITVQAEDAFGNTSTAEIKIDIKSRIISNPDGDAPAQGYARVKFIADETKAELVGTKVYDVYIDESNPVKLGSLEKPNVILREVSKYTFDEERDWKLETETAGVKSYTDISVRDNIVNDMNIVAVISSHEPIVENQTASVNETIEAKEFVTNKEQLPNGTTYSYKDTAPDTSTVGDKDVTIVVTKPNEEPQEFKVKLTVKDKIVNGDQEKPEGYVTVEFLAGKHGDFEQVEVEGVKTDQATKFYVDPKAIVKMSEIKAPTVTPKTGYEFDSWSKEFTENDIITGDRQITAVYRYKDAVSTTAVDGWKKVTLVSGDKGQFTKTVTQDGQEPQTTEYETLEYWVDPAREVTIPTPTVKTEVGVTHTGFDKSLTGTFVSETTINALYISSMDVIEDTEPSDPTRKPKGYVTVEFKAGDHGNFAANTVTRYFVNPNKSVSIGAPALDVEKGFVFTGYFNRQEAHSSEAKNYAEDVTYIAQYEDKSSQDIINGDQPKPAGYVTISFSAGEHGTFENVNGKVQTTSFHVDPNKELTLTTEAPTVTPKAGYTFANYNPDINVAKKYTEGEVITAQYTNNGIIEAGEDDTNRPEGYVTVEFKITDAAKGSFAQDAITRFWVPEKTNISLKSKEPAITVSDGYSHTGWLLNGYEDINLETERQFTANITTLIAKFEEGISQAPTELKASNKGEDDFTTVTGKAAKGATIEVKDAKGDVIPLKADTPVEYDNEGNFTVKLSKKLAPKDVVRVTAKEEGKKPSNEVTSEVFTDKNGDGIDDSTQTSTPAKSVKAANQGIKTTTTVKGKAKSGSKVEIKNANGEVIHTISELQPSSDNQPDSEGLIDFVVEVNPQVDTGKDISIVVTEKSKQDGSVMLPSDPIKTTVFKDADSDWNDDNKQDSETPTIVTPVKNGDTEVEVNGKEGAKVYVEITDADGNVTRTPETTLTPGEDGKTKVTVPALKDGQTIKVVQKDGDKQQVSSDPVNVKPDTTNLVKEIGNATPKTEDTNFKPEESSTDKELKDALEKANEAEQAANKVDSEGKQAPENDQKAVDDSKDRLTKALEEKGKFEEAKDKVDAAKNNPSEESIKAAQDSIDNMKDGEDKDKLQKDLDKIKLDDAIKRGEDKIKEIEKDPSKVDPEEKQKLEDAIKKAKDEKAKLEDGDTSNDPSTEDVDKIVKDIDDTINPKERTTEPVIKEAKVDGTKISGTAPSGSEVTVKVNDKVIGKVTTGEDGNWSITTDPLQEGQTIKVTAKEEGKTDSVEVTKNVGLDTEELGKSIDTAKAISGKDYENLDTNDDYDNKLKEALKNAEKVKDDADKAVEGTTQEMVDQAKEKLDRAIAQKEADNAVDRAKENPTSSNIQDAQDKIDAIPGSKDSQAEDYNPIKKELQDKLDLIKAIKDGEDRLKKDDVTGANNTAKKPSDDIDNLKTKIKEGKDALNSEDRKNDSAKTKEIVESISALNMERIVVGVESVGEGTKAIEIRTSVPRAKVVVTIDGEVVSKSQDWIDGELKDVDYITTDPFGTYSLGLTNELTQGQTIELKASKDKYNDGEYTEFIF